VRYAGRAEPCHKLGPSRARSRTEHEQLRLSTTRPPASDRPPIEPRCSRRRSPTGSRDGPPADTSLRKTASQPRSDLDEPDLVALAGVRRHATPRSPGESLV
jgi:hypothetical protein